MNWSVSNIQQYEAPPPPMTRSEKAHLREQQKRDNEEHLQTIERLERQLRQIQLKKQRAGGQNRSKTTTHSLHSHSSHSSHHDETSGKGKAPAFFDVLSPAEVVVCTECGIELPLRLLTQHHVTDCGGRYVECQQPGCAARFRESERSRHLQFECKTVKKNKRFVSKASKHFEPVQCPLGCPAGVTKKDIPRHVNTVCPRRTVICPHMGCEIRLSVQAMELHAVGEMVWKFTTNKINITQPRGVKVVQKASAAGILDVALVCEQEEDVVTTVVIRAAIGQLFDIASDLSFGGDRSDNSNIDDSNREDVGNNDDHETSNTTISGKDLKDVVAYTEPTCKVARNRQRMSQSSNKRRLEPIKCSPHHNMGCGKLILPKHLRKHERDDCPNRLVECGNSGCNEMIAFNILSFHQEQLCKAMLAKEALLEQGLQEYACPLGCGEYLLLSETIHHKKHECQYREVTCNTTGCGKKMPLYMLSNHEQIWDRRVETASQKFYYVNPDTEETAWEYPGCLLLLKRDYYLQKYEDRPKIVLCKLGCRTALKNQIKIIRSHVVNNCPNEMIPCPSAGKQCKTMILRRNVAEHTAKDCPVGLRSLRLARQGLAQRMLIDCPYCSCELQMKHLKRHTHYECSKRLVPCKFWDCKLMVPANAWYVHVLNDCEHRAKWRAGVAAARARIEKKGGVLLPHIFRSGGGGGASDGELSD
jgi:hypothetical protein